MQRLVAGQTLIESMFALPDGQRSAIGLSMNSAKNPFDSLSAESEVEAEARARADVRAGRLISHEAVRRWLLSLGSANPLPRPRVGD